MTELLANPDVVIVHSAIEEFVKDECVVDRKCRDKLIADAEHEQMFAKLEGDDSKGDMSWIRPAANDHEVGGSSNAPVIELSST